MRWTFIIIFFAILTTPFITLGQSGEEQFEAGFAFYEAGEYSKAIESYDQAIRLESGNAEYYYHRGVCKSLLFMNEEAIEDLDQAIKLDSAYAEAYFERAFSKYGLKRLEEAIDDYDKSISLTPEYGPAYLNRGTVKYELEDIDGACYDWRKAFNLGIEIANELVKEYCVSKT